MHKEYKIVDDVRDELRYDARIKVWREVWSKVNHEVSGEIVLVVAFFVFHCGFEGFLF